MKAVKKQYLRFNMSSQKFLEIIHSLNLEKFDIFNAKTPSEMEGLFKLKEDSITSLFIEALSVAEHKELVELLEKHPWKNSLYFSKVLINALSDERTDEKVMDLLITKLSNLDAFASTSEQNILKKWVVDNSKDFKLFFNYFNNKSYLDTPHNQSLSLINKLVGYESIPQSFKDKLLKEVVRENNVVKSNYFSILISVVSAVPSFSYFLNDIYDLTSNEKLKRGILFNFNKYNRALLNLEKDYPEDWKDIYPEILNKDLIAKQVSLEPQTREYYCVNFNLYDFILMSGSQSSYDDIGKFRANVSRMFKEQNSLTRILGSVQIGQAVEQEEMSIFIEKTQYDKELITDVLKICMSEVCRNGMSGKSLDILIEEYLLDKMIPENTTVKRKAPKF